MAVRPASAPPEYLVGRQVGMLETAPYASRDYLAQTGNAPARGTAAPDWAGHDWVVPDDALAHLAQARWVAEHVPPARRLVSVDSLVAMVDAVRHGMGIGMLLCLLAEHDAGLVRLARPDPALGTPLWILTHPDLRHSARVRAFNDFLYARLSASPWLKPAPAL